MLKKIAVGLFLVIAPLKNAQALDLARENSIWDLATGKQIDAKALIDVLANSGTILLGENHGTASHQNREAFLIGALAAREIYPTLALEMLDTDRGEIINNFRSQSPEETAGLATSLSWAASGWPDYSFYKPVFDIAFAAKLPIIGADMDENQKILVRDLPISGLDREELVSSWANTMKEAHCDLIEPNELGKITRLQIARDKFMAQRLNHYTPTILVAGSEHVRKDRGIPKLLREKGRTSVSIAFVSAKISKDQIQEKSKKIGIDQFDYVWVTELSSELGTCERLQKKGLIK